MELRCVSCGARVGRLLVQYSPGNIRLMKCEGCKAVADPYVECELMILLIDLILHKQKAYRHLLFNMLNHDKVSRESPGAFGHVTATGRRGRNFISSNKSAVMEYGPIALGILWKSCLIYFLSDMFRNALLGKEWDSSKSSLFLVWLCGKMLLQVFSGNFVFFGFLFLSTRTLLNNQNSSLGTTRFKGIMLAILLSSYFKIFLIAMMVWEFPSSVIFIIDIFVISSNAVALKVLTQLPTASCIGVLFGAHGTKFLVSTWLQIPSFTSF